MTSPPSHPSRFRVPRIRLRVLVLLFGVLAPIGIVLWTILGVPEDIEVSTETTVLTRYTTGGNQVDYIAWARERIGTADPTLDPWHLIFRPVSESERPVYVDPLSLVADRTDGRLVQQLLDRVARRQSVPFTTLDDPEFAQLVDANTEWYELVQRTTPAAPSVGGLQRGPMAASNLAEVLLPLAEIHRTISRRMLEYSMLQWGRGEHDDALKTLAFVFVCRDRERQLPIVIDQLVADALDELGARAIWSILLTEQNLTDERLQQIVDVRSRGGALRPMMEALRTEQLIGLDLMQYCRRTLAGNGMLISLAGPVPKVQGNMFCQRVRWNDQMRAYNRTFDTLEGLMRNEDYLESCAQMQAVIDEFRGDATANTSKTYTFEELYWLDANEYLRVKLAQLLPFPAVRRIPAQVRNRDQLLTLAASLHAWRRDHGAFPDTLDELGGEQTLMDATTMRPFDYRKTSNGFRILIPGPNGQEDDPADPLQHDDDNWVWPPEPLGQSDSTDR